MARSWREMVRTRPAVLAGLFVLACVPVTFAAAGVGVGGAGLVSWLSTWASPAAFVVAAALCFGRARAARTERGVWLGVGTACSLWALANLYYALFFAPHPLPLPSLADLGYAGFPVALCAGLVAYARLHLSRIPVDLWLDALVAALSTAALAAALILGIEDIVTTDLAGVLTTLVYPLADVVILGVLVGIWSMMGWGGDRRMYLFVAAALLIAAADTLTFGSVLSGEVIGGALCNIGWTAGVALLSSAAWLGGPRVAPAHGSPRHRLLLPVLFSGLAVVVLMLAGLMHLSTIASALAAAALAASCVRLLRSFHEAHALADSHRLAITDHLTQLPNRRRLIADLEQVCSEQEPSVLALFDLDGFKLFNDTYGHPEGDALLARIAGRLARAVEPHGRAYRLGGDEFCVLAPAAIDRCALMDTARKALTEQGVEWSITASFGTVEMPREACSVSEALRIADRRMYAQKDRRPAGARQQAADVLLRALDEQQPTLGEHAQDVTALAGAVAARLALSDEEIDDVVRAAELHDVGKLAIPREILDKPGPLDDAEWEQMRRHTIVGERMLLAAPALRPIAGLVRSSHERWDGAGYPDGLAGEQIPIGARIIAVCDSYDAMITDRAYRKGIAPVAARAELLRCAGTQFDLDVVEAFLDVLADVSVAARSRELMA